MLTSLVGIRRFSNVNPVPRTYVRGFGALPLQGGWNIHPVRLWSRLGLRSFGVRPSALDTPVRLRVRGALRSGKFPLASPLPSTTSATVPTALFGGFTGTIRLSDFPPLCIIGVRPWTSRCGLRFPLPQTKAGPPGSRAGCFRPCIGSQAARGSHASRDIDAPVVAFRFLLKRRPLEAYQQFRGSMPSLDVPLSTLHRGPYEQQRMTRGQSGSLLLLCMALSSTTPHRFSRRTAGC